MRHAKPVNGRGTPIDADSTGGLRFVDLFAGLGGFHQALASIGHVCVFASEIDDELRNLYKTNYPDTASVTYGDIRDSKTFVPPHDVLCAGFPCQPFSKSGFQEGALDKTRGTLFHEILEILDSHHPPFVLLENVGNFEQHDGGNTWRVARGGLEELGYSVDATLHVKSGGSGLLSPHHLGHPHSRERFFVACRLSGSAAGVIPQRKLTATNLATILQDESELSDDDKAETKLTPRQVDCVDHWNALVKKFPADDDLPSFPIWGDEFGATYPYIDTTPFLADSKVLLAATRQIGGAAGMLHHDLIALLPHYAREQKARFPPWKEKFIKQSRDWYGDHADLFDSAWLGTLRSFPPSLRKLEWNCKGETRDLWEHVLQFRPSGLRVKRMASSPALVAMTTTQVPIIGPRRRFITRIEGLRLQGFRDGHHLPASRESAFRALGNAVHVDVVKAVAERLLAGHDWQTAQPTVLSLPIAEPDGSRQIAQVGA